MLPYASSGGYGYGRRKGVLASQNSVVVVLAVLSIASLGFSVFTHFRASSANAHKAALRSELDTVRSELQSIKSQFSSRNAELEQLQLTHGHTQRRLTELTSQLQRKEADLVSKEQALQQHVRERGVVDQHRSGRESELSKMVEDLRSELIRSDGVIEALDSKVAQMEAAHSSREKDWHNLANKWIKYEQDLHDQYKKCTDEVSKLRNQTTTMNATEPVPEAEPKLRPETDFGQIRTEVPVHKPHHFEPLPPATPQAQQSTDLPLPEAKIRDSVIQMTGGQVGLEGQQHGQQASPSPAPADGSPSPQAPQPSDHIHHADTYHHDFMHDDDPAHLHHYDHYHGHYDSYDPMDEWWLHDAHGDWNADDQQHHQHVDHHIASDNTHAHLDQNVDHGNHHYQDQHHHQDHHNNNQHHHDPLAHHQQRRHFQEVHPGDTHHHQHDQQQHGHHPQPHAMQGMGMDHHQQHAQHAPSHWQQPDTHQQDQYHHHYQQQQHQQQHQQEHGGHHQHHHEHPKGDLAYKMGW